MRLGMSTLSGAPTLRALDVGITSKFCLEQRNDLISTKL